MPLWLCQYDAPLLAYPTRPQAVAALQAGWRWDPAQRMEPGAARVPAQGCAA